MRKLVEGLASVAKLQYYQHGVEILRFNGDLSVAKARATFTDIKRILRERQGVCYGKMLPARFSIQEGEC